MHLKKREKFFEILKDNSLPGCSKLFKTSQKIIKILWFACLLILSVICAWFLKYGINSYFNYDVVANINTYREFETIFPAVTFCITHDSDEIPLLNSTLVDCQFDSKVCKWYDFEVYSILFIKLVCYRFNSGKDYFNNSKPLEKVNNYGNNQKSLEIQFRIKGFIKDFSIYNPFKMLLYISNQSQTFRLDRAYNSDDGLLIPPGLNYISIKRQFIKKLSEPYNSCVKQNDINYPSYLFQYFIQNNLTYLQRDCFDLCLEKIMLDSCNCSAKLGKIAYCLSNKTILECALNIYNVYATSKKQLPENCFINCPLECDFVVYSIDQNYFGVPSNEYGQIYNLSEKSLSDYVYLNIFFSSNEYSLLEEIPKQNVYDLISSIGGSLGLFIGISLVSFVEIIEILIKFIWLIFLKNPVHNIQK